MVRVLALWSCARYAKKLSQMLKIKLTQEGKKVDNATNIQFEIWKKDNNKDHEVIEAQYEGDGIYRAEKTFNKDGLYYIKADVTAHDLHVMPTKQVIVGKISEEELKLLQKESQDHAGHHDHH
nr:FixH family protein [Ectobacillus panaciterrae]